MSSCAARAHRCNESNVRRFCPVACHSCILCNRTARAAVVAALAIHSAAGMAVGTPHEACASPNANSWCCNSGMLVNDDRYPICAVTPIAAATNEQLITGGQHGHDLGPSVFLPLTRVWDELALQNLSLMNGVGINLGARDGKVDDPLYPLSRSRGMRVIAFEYQARFCPSLRKHLPNGTISCPTRLLPDRIVEQLRATGAPADADVLKIDIDSCDAQLLDLLLQGGFNPKVIQIEVNQYMPPPLLLGRNCGLDLAGGAPASPSRANCLFGSSAAYVDRIMSAAGERGTAASESGGYRLLQYNWPDLVYVRADWAARFSRRLPSDVGTVFEIGIAHARKHHARYRGQIVRDYGPSDSRCDAWGGLLEQGRQGMYKALHLLKELVNETGDWTLRSGVTVGIDPGVHIGARGAPIALASHSHAHL